MNPHCLNEGILSLYLFKAVPTFLFVLLSYIRLTALNTVLHIRPTPQSCVLPIDYATLPCLYARACQQTLLHSLSIPRRTFRFIF
jgi:hypothetical protein